MVPLPMDFTALINSSGKCDSEAFAKAYSAVYAELRIVAKNQLRMGWQSNTISATALVNEVYLKLIKAERLNIGNKAHFFALAATAMRQLLVNYAKEKRALKRGGDLLQVTFSETLLQSHHKVEDLIAVDQAIELIREVDEKLAQLVELRFFGGMTESEMSQVFGVTERTLRRNWRKAKVLLTQALSSETGEGV